MRPDKGHDHAHYPAGKGTHGERRRRAEQHHQEPRLGPAAELDDPRHGEPGDIGGEGDREIEPAGQDRQQHGERQQPELRQLEGDRLEGAGGEEARRRQAEEDEHQGEKKEQPEDLALATQQPGEQGLHQPFPRA